MSLTTCIQRKPLLPPSPLGFQMKPLFSLPPLGRFAEPLGQNSNADELIFPSIQLSEISIASNENIASLSKSSESTSDIQLQENQIDSNSNNQSISNREFISSDNISQANDEITVAPKVDAEEKQLPEPLESLKPLAQNSDFYISRFVADYLSNKPGVYSTALSRSQNPIEDNQNIENLASTVTSEKNYQIEPKQQVNKIQTRLEKVTSDSDDSLSSQSLSNLDLSNIENQTEVLAKDNRVNSEFTPTSESNFQSDNQDVTVTSTNKGLSKSPQLDNSQVFSQPATPDFNISPQINQSEAGNINKTPTDLNQTQLNSPALPESNPAVPNLPEESDGIELINQKIINSKQQSNAIQKQLKTAQIQTSPTEDKLNPQLEPSFKTSSEATPKLNPSKNQIEKQDVVESTPTYDNKLQQNIENDSNNNSENISENKHQPSNSTQNKEIPDSDSKLIQSQLETAQSPIIKDNTNSNQSTKYQLTESEVYSQPSLENNLDIQPRQTTAQTNIQRTTSLPETPSVHAGNSLFQAISLSKTSSDIPQTVQKNTENLTNKPDKSNYSQLSPLIKQSDLQLSKFVNDFSNLSATYPQNHLQAFTQSSQQNELYNFENPRFLQQSPEISSRISNNTPESKFNQNQNQNQNLNPNTINLDKSINTNDEGDLSVNNDFSNNETSNNDTNLIHTKSENNYSKANNDVIPDSWSNISELIENTSPDKLQQSPNISEINNQHYDDTQFTNASSPNQVNSHNNQYISQPKAADSQLNESETNHISNHQINDTWSNVSELIAKNYQQPSEILKKTTDELTSLYSNINQEELTSSHNITSQSENSPDTKHKSINDEELNILAYQIYTIIRQKLEVDRECLGRELFGYSEWSNIIPLNLSIGSYHKINQVDFLQPKMNMLAIEVYKLISIRLEVEKERCIR